MGFPINRRLPVLSEEHKWSGKTELSYRSARKTCVSPMRPSLLIDGDAAKTFTNRKRNRGKEMPSSIRRRISPYSHMRMAARLRPKERVSRPSASSHTSRQGRHNRERGALIFVWSFTSYNLSSGHVHWTPVGVKGISEEPREI